MEFVYGGIDWGEKKHQVELVDSDGHTIFHKRVSTDPKSLYKLASQLLDVVDNKPERLHIAIEDPTRPVVGVLLGAGFCLFSINPRQVDRLRDVYRLSGAKDDASDAYVIANEKRIHPQVFHQIQPDHPVVAELREVIRACKERSDEATQYLLRLRHHLNRYFPQFLQLEWKLDSRVMLDLLELIPSPEHVEQANIDKIEKALGRCRKHTAEEVFNILRGPGHPLNPGTARGAQARAVQEAQNLRMVIRQENAWEARAKALLERLSELQRAEQEDKTAPTDVEITLSLPGVGVRNTAGLFADGHQAIVERDLERLRRQSIAPVTRQTGQQKHQRRGHTPLVHRRFACSQYLSQTMFQIGDSAQRHSPHYRERYSKMRDKGHTHGRSCRQLADQILRPFFAMLRDRTLYNPSMHGATRRAQKERGRKDHA